MFSHGKRLDECHPLSCTNAAVRDAECGQSSSSSSRAAAAAASSPLKKARSVDFLGRLSIRSASLTGEGTLSAAASQFSRRAARGVYSNGYVPSHCLSSGGGGRVRFRLVGTREIRTGDELAPSLNFCLTWFVPTLGIIITIYSPAECAC